MTSLLVKDLESATIRVSSDEIKSIVLLPNNQLICIVNHQVCLYDIKSGKIVAKHKNRHEYEQICYRDAEFVSIFNESLHEVRISTLKVENGAFVERVEDKKIFQENFAKIKFSPKGKTLVCANNNSLTWCAHPNGELKCVPNINVYDPTVVFSGDGNTFAVHRFHKFGNFAWIIETKSKKTFQKIFPNFFTNLFLSYDGSVAAVFPRIANEFKCWLFERKSWKKIKEIQLCSHGVSCSFSTDDRFMAIGTQHGDVTLFSLAPDTLGELIFTFRIVFDPIKNICFSRDGSRIAYSVGQTIKVWNFREFFQKQMLDRVLPLAKCLHLSLETIKHICNIDMKIAKYFKKELSHMITEIKKRN